MIPISALGQVVPASQQSIIASSLTYETNWVPSKTQTDSAFQDVLYFFKTKGYQYSDTTNWLYGSYHTDSIDDYKIQSIFWIYGLLQSNSYCVQFKGNYNKLHEKCIIVNFFPVETDTLNYNPYCSCNCSAKYGLRVNDKTKENLHFTIDGGYYHWRITYNYIRKKCTDYRVNSVG
jgi:hypothetical protein